MSTPALENDRPSRDVDPNRLLRSLLVPAMIMPLAGWMFTISLPIIRDDFGIAPDVAAWIATAFSLPFMVFMPIYGRISDGLGKRRLLLGGISVFIIGTLLVIFSSGLPSLLAGRAIQGIGAAGLVPLSLALITEVFPSDQRGRAMGVFSSVGPLAGIIGPVLAGVIVAQFGWRAAFAPAAVFALIAIFVIYWTIPTGIRTIRIEFLKTFDWLGVVLLATALTFFLFYLSSRPITGRQPLTDWRLLAVTLIFISAFVWHERRRFDPFIRLKILNNRALVIASICAMLRMMGMSGGLGFLMPLYLADILDLEPTMTGFFLMANPVAMVIVVRFAGSFADRWGSRSIVMIGFAIFASVMGIISFLPAEYPRIYLIVLVFIFGIGAGFMLATLHRAALNEVNDADLGTASGLYSMIRFLGSTLGAAIGGILLQYYFQRSGDNLLPAYQTVFRWYLVFPLSGVLFASFLPKRK